MLTSKKILILNIVFLTIIHICLADTLIIPKKKPILSKELIKKKISKGILIPPIKPTNVIKKPIKKTVEKEKSNKIDGIIIPKSKPLIVTKDKSKKAKTSKYFSKKDFEYASKAIQQMEKARWIGALKIAKKAKDKTIYDFILWRYLLTSRNQATFTDYKQFILRNPNFPRIGRIKYLAEHKLSTNNLSKKEITSWFEANPPLSGFGKMVQGEILITNGNDNLGSKLIKDGFITAELSRSELKIVRKKYKKYIKHETKRTEKI